MSSTPKLSCLRQQSAPLSALVSILGGILLGVAIRLICLMVLAGDIRADGFNTLLPQFLAGFSLCCPRVVLIDAGSAGF